MEVLTCVFSLLLWLLPIEPPMNIWSGDQGSLDTWVPWDSKNQIDSWLQHLWPFTDSTLKHTSFCVTEVCLLVLELWSEGQALGFVYIYRPVNFALWEHRLKKPCLWTFLLHCYISPIFPRRVHIHFCMEAQLFSVTKWTPLAVLVWWQAELSLQLYRSVLYLYSLKAAAFQGHASNQPEYRWCWDLFPPLWDTDRC